MNEIEIDGIQVPHTHHHTLIVGAGAAGMNCAKKLYESLSQAGFEHARESIAVVARGLRLGTSRMSGSDKQTYYKLGTSASVADSAASFAESLTASGCCHRDLAYAEGIGSLRGFYNLVEAGVPFPHNAAGSYIGYKTDHDPYERATSAGPKTSKYMSERLEAIVRRYGIEIFDRQESVALIKADRNRPERISGLLTIDSELAGQTSPGWRVFTADNFVLAAGGPGGIYQRTVYPKGQIGMHGIAFKAGLVAENLTESQFGLASIKFRWNVSGSYMQSIPRIYSTDRDGEDRRDFLGPLFSSTARLATATFLKGYQWPFDPQRISEEQSSLIDLAVHNQTAAGRRVFMDFLSNPLGDAGEGEFSIASLEAEAREYLEATGAVQSLPIERLAQLNPKAIELYREHDIDLYRQPLEIAVCAQHCNGGFAVDHWWESNIPHTFVVGEMAGTHGVKRPGGSALNAGQVGSQRAAEFIAAKYRIEDAHIDCDKLVHHIQTVFKRYCRQTSQDALDAAQVAQQLRERMSAAAGHIRRLKDAQRALREARELCVLVDSLGFRIENAGEMTQAVQADHLAYASLAFLTAVCNLLEQGSGSRGSHLVVSPHGDQLKTELLDPQTGGTYKIMPENTELRDMVQRLIRDAENDSKFIADMIPVRKFVDLDRAFEPAWSDFLAGRIYD